MTVVIATKQKSAQVIINKGGTQGPAGPTGPQGPTGPSGIPGNTGVTAGTYGGSSNVAVFTVMSNGLLLFAGNTPVSGISNFTVSGNSFVLSTSTGANYYANIQTNSIRLGTDTTGSYVGNLIAGTGVNITNLGDEGATPTITIGQDVSVTSNVTFANITSTGVFLSGNIIPRQNVTYSLGNATHRFSNIFLSGSTIDIGGAAIKYEGGIFKLLDPNGNPARTLIYTSNIIEAGNTTSGNVFFTNARVYAALSSGNTISFNPVTGNITLTPSGVTASTYGSSRQVPTYDVDQFGRITRAANVAFGDIVLGTETSGAYVANLIAGTGVTLTNLGNEGTIPTIAIGQAVATTSDVTFANVTVSGKLLSNDITASSVTIDGDAIITGNLLVQGNTVVFNTETVNVEDKNILLANGAASAALANGAGITVDGAGATFTYASTGDKWTTNKSLDVTGTLFATTIDRNPFVNVTLSGDITGTANVSLNNLTGNTLQISTTIQPNSVALGTDTTGDYVSNLTAGTGVILSNLGGEGINPTIAIGQNVATTANVTFNNVVAVGNVVASLYLGTGTNTTITANTAIFTFDTAGNVTIPNAAVANIVYANVYQNLYSSNVIEGTNLFFTNARARSAITAANGINYDAVTGLLTSALKVELVNVSNVASVSVANVRTIQFESDSGFDVVDRANGIAKVQMNSTFKTWNVLGQANLVATGLDTVRFVPGNFLSITTNATSDPKEIRFDANLSTKANVADLTTSNVTEGTNLYFTNARVYSAVTGNLALKANVTDLNTSNVIEGTNLYYTNARVYAAITGNLALKANVTDLSTSNVTEGTNLYFTNARVYAAVTSNLALKANVTDLSTSNITEGTNLYYTNARVIGSVTPLLTTSNVVELTNLYYTNARVYANIAPLLTTSNVTEGTNLYYTNARVYAGIAGNLALKANVVDLTTANIAELTNLYYTNARVYANIAPLLTTANIAELTNLYYTNARVYANIAPLLTTSNVTEGTNLYFTNARVYAAVTANFAAKANVTDLTTANVTELNNLYYTNARVYAAVTGNLAAKANVTDLNTSNVTEGTNLYYTNARVYAAVTGNLATKANVADLTTSNVTEGTNLYFTNARVYANVISLLPTYTGNIGGNLVGIYTNTSIFAGSSEFIFDNAGNVTIPNAIRANILYANSIQNLTTSNLTEGSNLYFTNARAYANTLSAIKTGNGIVYNSSTGNITLSATGVSSTTYGSSRIVPTFDVDQHGRLTRAANVAFGDIVLGTETSGAYLANVIAGTGVTITNQGGEGATPTISIGQNVSPTSNVEFFNVTITGNLNVTGNVTQFNVNVLEIEDNMIYLNANSTVSNPDIGFAGNYNDGIYQHAGLFRDATDGVWKFYDGYRPEPDASPYIDTANIYFRYANVAVNHLTAANSVTGVNARFTANVTADKFISENNGNGENYKVGDDIWLGDTNIANTLRIKGQQDATQGYIAFGNNDGVSLGRQGSNALTYTGAFTATGNVTAGNITSTAATFTYSRLGIVESGTWNGSSISTTYTDAKVTSVANQTGAITNVQLAAAVNQTGIFTTSNVIEGANLYYTNARVYSAITGNLATKANVTDLTTSNVTEGTNLYFTNARTYANVISLLPTYTGNVSGNFVGAFTNTSIIAGSYEFIFDNAGNVNVPNALRANILYANTIQNLTTSNLTEGTNLYYTNARVYAAVTSNLALKANVTDLSTSNVTEGTNLYYTNARVYAAVTGNLAAKANVTDLTTANVAELTNLYFTNARVNAALSMQTLGNVTFGNVVLINNGGGDEGGELRLAIPATNSSLSGPIAIDIYQNRIRFFETSGTNRGAYIDLTAANATVGTNLLTGGGGGGGGSGTITSVAGITSGLVTNAQLASAVSQAGILTTSNVTEGTNLYFTNARVAANVVAYLPSYTGNIAANVVGSLTNTSVLAGTYEFIFDNAGNVIVPNALRANILYANTIQNLTTSNLTEGTNLYFTNARVYAAVTGNLAAKANVTDLTTSNVTEGTNLYYTNARVYAAVTGNLAAKANVTDLTTSNVTEGTNLYFTNARSYANVISLLPAYTGNISAANIYAGNITATGNINFSNLVGTYANTSIVAGSYTFTFDNSGNVIIPGAVRANILYANTIQNLTTSNLTEGTNLYFTNARSRLALTSGNGISYSNTTGNITLSTTGVTASTYGNSIFVPVFTVDSYGRLSSASNVAIQGVTGFSATGNSFTISTASGSSFVANIQLDSIRLGTDTTGFYVGNIIASTGVYKVSAGGENDSVTLSIGQNVDTTSNVTFANVTVNGTLFSNDITASSILIDGNAVITGNLTVSGNTIIINAEELYLADNQIVLNSNHSGAPTQDAGILINRGSSANVDIRWNESTDKWSFTNDGSTYYVLPTSTTDLTEGTNLYYTNTRAYANTLSAIKTGNGIVYNSSTGNITLSATGVTATTYGSASIVPVFVVDAYGRITSASNVAIPSQASIQIKRFIYNGTSTQTVFSGADINGSTLALSDTGNVLVYLNGILLTATDDYTAYSGNITLTQGLTAAGNITIIENFFSASNVNLTGASTTDLTEGTNLYFTNARARLALTSGNGIAYSNTTGNITLSPTGVSATTYGNATIVPVITVDAYGRVTSASNVSISATGGASVTVSDNPPAITTAGVFWLDSLYLDLYVSYDNVWVMVGNGGTPTDTFNPFLLSSM